MQEEQIKFNKIYIFFYIFRHSSAKVQTVLQRDTLINHIQEFKYKKNSSQIPNLIYYLQHNVQSYVYFITYNIVYNIIKHLYYQYMRCDDDKQKTTSEKTEDKRIRSRRIAA